MEVSYRTGNDFTLEQVLDVYRNSALGARRPLEDSDRMHAMLANANLIVSAWDGEAMVGIARALSDFSYTTYLADLAVRESHQRRGIGLEMMRRIRALAGPDASLVLLAAPSAEEYYPHIGFTRHPHAYTLGSNETL